MPVHNADVAAIFNEIADLLELEEANPFRVRAYRSAARVVGDLSRDIVAMVNEGEDLTELPGVGEDLAGKIREIVTTGRSTLLSELRKQTPPVLTQLLAIPGLGPKRVQALHRDLHIRHGRATGPRRPRGTDPRASRLRRKDRATDPAGHRDPDRRRGARPAGRWPCNTPSRWSIT